MLFPASAARTSCSLMFRNCATALALALFASPSDAVILDSSGDPLVNRTAPTGALADSGWQYLGLWGNFIGTPVAQDWFVTAKHVGGNVGQNFTFDGMTYPTVGVVSDPDTDLNFWQVAGNFPTWAPLYTGNDEIGQPLTVFGRGTQRGTEVIGADNGLRGWRWGLADGQVRWGTNTVTGIFDGGAGVGELLHAEFNHIGGSEAHLSAGDSGGPVFIQDTDGVWKLAAVNYAVTGPFYTDAQGGGEFLAALFDSSGFFVRDGPNTFAPTTGPTSFFSTRISDRQVFITGSVPEPSSAVLLVAAAACALRRRRRPEAIELPLLAA